VSGDRDGVQQRLQEAGVGSAIHYPIPIHQQPIMRELGFGDYSLPVAEAAAESVLSLPVHPLTADEVAYVAQAVNAAVRGYRFALQCPRGRNHPCGYGRA
jgi:dTDP-4-amino-4,6-dideoxygalactose transaminase